MFESVLIEDCQYILQYSLYTFFSKLEATCETTSLFFHILCKKSIYLIREFRAITVKHRPLPQNLPPPLPSPPPPTHTQTHKHTHTYAVALNEVNLIDINMRVHPSIC